MELYRKHRPKLFKDVRGQAAAVSQLQGLLRKGVPHALILHGPSGCGKTTAARILASKIGARNSVVEVNAADLRGIDHIRQIEYQSRLKPLGSDAQVWIIDEAHQLTKDAQNCALKMLEDAPDWSYFFFPTTDPQKLLPTVLTRCAKVQFASMGDDDVRAVIGDLLAKIKEDLDAEIVQKIVDSACGSARQAAVLLENVLAAAPEHRMKVAESGDLQRVAKDIVKEIMPWRGRPNWEAVRRVLQTFEGDGEAVRRQVMGLAAAALVKGGNKYAYIVLDAFRDEFYSSPKARLILACYEACHAER